MKSNLGTEEDKIFQRGEKTRLIFERFKGSVEETSRVLINLIFLLLPVCHLEMVFLYVSFPKASESSVTWDSPNSM